MITTVEEWNQQQVNHCFPTTIPVWIMLLRSAIWKSFVFMNKIDPYCCMESRSKKSLPAELEWMNWPNVLYADLYNYLILSPDMSHEKLKAFKSLEGYNQFINSWVSGVVMTVAPSTPKIYLFIAQVKHSQRLSDTPLKCG